MTAVLLEKESSSMLEQLLNDMVVAHLRNERSPIVGTALPVVEGLKVEILVEVQWGMGLVMGGVLI
jgi:hypothetical protein